MDSFEELLTKIRRDNDKTLEKLISRHEGIIPLENISDSLNRNLEIEKIIFDGTYTLLIRNKNNEAFKSKAPLVCNHGTMVDPVEGYMLNLLYKSQHFETVIAPSRIRKGRKNNIKWLQKFACEQVKPFLEGNDYYLWGHSQGALTNVFMYKKISGAKGMVNVSPPVRTDKEYWEIIMNVVQCGVNDITRSRVKNILFKGFHRNSLLKSLSDFDGIKKLAREFSRYSHDKVGRVDIPTLNVLSGWDEIYDYKSVMDSLPEIYVHPDSCNLLLPEMPHDWFTYNGNRKAETTINTNFFFDKDEPFYLIPPKRSLVGSCLGKGLGAAIYAGYSIKAIHDLGNDIANVSPDIHLTRKDFYGKMGNEYPF
mgnify:CR=1 FL=1